MNTTTSGRTLRPVDPSGLHWLAPATMDGETLLATRARLERILTQPQRDEVYAAKRRSIFLVRDEELGPVAIKEMRYEGPARALWFRRVRFRDALREFRIGSAFEARGGATPAIFGAALDYQPLALRRVLLFMRWIDGAVTLTKYLETRDEQEHPAVMERVARALVDAARLGLVHGRHSSENLLVHDGPGGESIHTIDFAYSRLHDSLQEKGFLRDVARVAHWLWHERTCSDAALMELFEAVARYAWREPAAARSRVERMSSELARWQRLFDRA